MTRASEQVSKALQTDIQACLRSYPSLSAKDDTFVCNDGTTEHMVSLRGTVPITCHGQSFFIPVTLWVPHLFPSAPPVCYVTPVPGMLLAPRHAFVDSNGHVDLSALRVPTKPTLAQLVAHLSAAFSHHPPVYSTGPTPPTATPAALAATQSMPSIARGHSITIPSSSASSSASLNTTTAVAAGGALVNVGRRTSMPLHRSTEAPSPWASGVQAQRPPSLAHTYASPNPSSYFDVGRGFAAGHMSTAVEPPTRLLLHGRVQKAVRAMWGDLLDGVEAHTQCQERLTRENADLDTALVQLQTTVAQLQSAREDVEKENDELDAWITAQMAKPDLPIEEVVFPADAYSKQQVDYAAEDAAIEDVLYSLGKALGEGRIDLKAYLKQARALSRKQFFARLNAKIVQPP